MERFVNKVLKTNSCWIWTGALRGKTGYGAFKLNGKVVDAHRVSFLLFKGGIPKDVQVCHSCDNRVCVNPDHLFLGSRKDNMQDCLKKGRWRKSYPHSHPSLWSYTKGCRCDGCKKSKAIYTKLYRLSKKKANF